MLWTLLLQIITLLPPAPPWSGKGDAHYALQVQSLAQQPVWNHKATEALHAQHLEQEQILVQLLAQGTDAEVKLSALLAAGCRGETPLGLALWRRAAVDFEETRILACLLAPASVPPKSFALLSWIATDGDRSLPQRAAACARLLDADQWGAWPLVKTILLTGTPADAKSPLANWNRTGRYELPKRLLLLSIQDLLKRHGLEATPFEPNAAWSKQLESLQKLQTQLQHLLQEPPIAPFPLPASWGTLKKLALGGNPHGRSAIAILSPQETLPRPPTDHP